MIYTCTAAVYNDMGVTLHFQCTDIVLSCFDHTLVIFFRQHLPKEDYQSEVEVANYCDITALNCVNLMTLNYLQLNMSN